MNLIKGIARKIVKKVEERNSKLGQGRSIGLIGFVDKDGYISSHGGMVDGGLSGVPFRKLLSTVVDKTEGPLLNLINQLPDNAVYISTAPGKTGIIINTAGINIFDLPIIKIGIKNNKAVAAGIIYPEKKLFELASYSEKMQLKNLAANTMEEEREALRELSKLRLKYIEISGEVPFVDRELSYIKPSTVLQSKKEIETARGLKKTFAEKLVAKSNEIEQGREVAAIGIINDKGCIEQAGEVVVGGMGYVPSRLLASGFKDITGISLRKSYTNIIPENSVIVHTHPGGTGVMHMGDAMAGPGTWGRSIVAIGHDRDGNIKGATIIDYSQEMGELIDEYEELDQLFFQAETQVEEAKIRKKRYQIAQDFTDLCRSLEIS
ncbi:MAG: peptidase S7 [Halanaerobiales bacterium]